MSTRSSSQIVARMRLSHTLLRSAGAAVGLLGTVILIAWHCRWNAILQATPGANIMKYNTAACFVSFSIAVALLTTRYARAAIVPTAVAAVAAVLSLLEYLTPMRFGIDELAVKDYIFAASPNPGLMPPLTAGCFVLLSVSLFLAPTSLRPAWRVAWIGALACIVAVIASVALFGYLVGIQAAYGWGAYAALAGRAEIVTAPTLQAAEQLLGESRFSLVVLDLQLPDGSGLQLLEKLPKVVGQSIPVVILSVNEVPREVQQRVAASLVKSRVSEAHIVQTILSLVPLATASHG